MKLSEIASALGLEFKGADTEIKKICSYEEIEGGALVPLLGKNMPEGIFESEAAAFLVKKGTEPGNGSSFLLAEDAETALVDALKLLYPVNHPKPGVHKSAFVSESAVVGRDVFIGAFAFIGENCVIGDGCVIYNNVSIADGVTLGKDCVIYPNASIYSGSRLLDRVMIHSGSVIGADGFGYYQKKGAHVKIPHIGGVLLGSDVEIGANSCVDRGKFSETVIGEGTKIDNLVQVGHNCKMGRGCIMAGQSALAGSTTLGDYVIMGARSGIADHLSIASGTILAGGCGVISDIDKPGIYAGIPHTTRKAWLRETLLTRSLPELVKRVEELERKDK